MAQKYTVFLICILKLNKYFFKKDLNNDMILKVKLMGLGGRGMAQMRKHKHLNPDSQRLHKSWLVFITPVPKSEKILEAHWPPSLDSG